ncbi:MAG: cytochrome c oxidase subunit II [Xanthomonadales bacterium]|nr:cytochrome c oxidase subunit II [Xanthomonadales bacterium]
MTPRRILACLAMLVVTTVPALAANPQRWQLNMTPGVTEYSRQVYDLHMLILWICVVIGVIVFGAMGYAIFKFRKSKGAVAAKWSHSTVAEVTWTVIPVLILIGTAWPATKTLIWIDDARESEMTIKVTGYQWLWRYEYIGTDVNFISRMDRESDRTRMLRSGMDPAAVQRDGENVYLLDVDNPLVLPTNTKVRFVITANDVIHSFWVPALGWKQDAIPGFINEAWTEIHTPGTYRGQCAELCGKDHAFMPIVIEAVPREQFDIWLEEQNRLAAGDAGDSNAPLAQLAADDALLANATESL